MSDTAYGDTAHYSSGVRGGGTLYIPIGGGGAPSQTEGEHCGAEEELRRVAVRDQIVMLMDVKF